MADDLLSFVHDTDYTDLPDPVIHQAHRCLVDLVGTAAAGTRTRLSEIIRDHVAAHHARADRVLFFDGRGVSPPGAALANAATIDSMDGHDGHRLTKGHAGAAVLPAIAALVPGEASGRDLLTALVVGYELATRAGIALHASAADYHSSGAWNSLGAAAVGARLLGLGTHETEHALGIAEYHGPRAPMMRTIDHPTMVKDSSAWGAHAGVTAALLAADGFTGAPAALPGVSGGAACDDLWGDFGRRWRILEQYFKPHPVCRWAQPAVKAVIELLEGSGVGPRAIHHIEVRAFEAACRLAVRRPDSTEQAQYSLAFPVALAAVYRDVPVDAVARPESADDQVNRLAGGLRLTERPEYTALFPAVRRSDVSIVLTDGTTLTSGPTEADGDPERPLSDRRLATKFRGNVEGMLGVDRGRDLLSTLRNAEEHRVGSLLALIGCPAA